MSNITRSPDRLTAGCGVAVTALLVAGSLFGCATAPAQRDAHVLAFENASPDVVRLYIQAGDRPLMIARLGPFERRTLMLRPGTLPPGAGRARLLVLPVGAPTIVAGVDRNWSTIFSEPYPVRDLLAHRWIYSGSRIIAARGGSWHQDRPSTTTDAAPSPM